MGNARTHIHTVTPLTLGKVYSQQEVNLRLQLGGDQSGKIRIWAGKHKHEQSVQPLIQHWRTHSSRLLPVKEAGGSGQAAIGDCIQR